MGDEPGPGRLPPHPAQSGLLAAPAGPLTLNSSCAYLVRGHLDPTRLADAYNRALPEFDALRLVWSAVPDPGWVAGPGPRVQATQTDLRGQQLTSASKPSHHLNELLERHANTPFDPACGPAGAIGIWHLADDTWAVAEAFTHLLADGRSLALLHEAVAAAYSDPAAAPHRYQPYARVLAGAPAGDADERYWRDAFAGYQALAAADTAPGGPAADWAATLTAADTARLEHAAGQSRATLATALLAAHAHAVARHCGTGDIATHLTIDARTAADLNVFGQLTTALPLRVRHDWATPVTRHLTAVTRAVLALREHAHAQAGALAELGVPVAMSSPDVTAFVMQPYATAPDLTGTLTSVIPLRSTDQAGGLATVARPGPDGSLTLTLRAAPGSRLARTVGSIGATILATLDAIACRPSTLLGSETLLPARARDLIRATATPAAAHPYRPLGSDITACLAALGPREVLSDGQQSHSAASMLEQIRVAEQRMLKAGTREGDTVMAGDLPLSDRIAAYVAALRLGAVYLPFATVPPPAQDGPPGWATLATAAGTSRCPGQRVPARGPGPLAPAYVIYTSGSSGRPKGVIVSREALSNLARGEAGRFGIGPDSRILLVAPPATDPWICHVTTALLTGATLVAGDPSSGPPLAEQIRAAGVTHAFLPAALLRSLGTRDLPSLQVIATAGDTCRAADLAGFGRARVFNIYGPTEATVTATVAEITRPTNPVPIGRPIRGLGARVVIDRAADVPPGATGELVISGAGVADGYLSDPGRTRDAFRVSPADPGERWYCTGDLARLDPGGDLFHLGRIDRQVKIRGWRVGLDALEAAARASGLCGDARAMAHTVPPSLDARLVLFAERCPDTAALHAALRRTVPAPSVPHHVTAVDALPRQASGKIDDSRLAADYEAGRQAELPAARPAGALARAWNEVLGAPPRPGDSFFDAGGDSLNVLSLVYRARQEGVDLDPADVYAHPEYQDLDNLCHDRRRARRPSSQGPAADRLPLGPSQQWLLAMNPADLAVWTQSSIIGFAELPSPEQIRHALNALTAATPVLRSALAGSGFLTVLPETHVPVTMTDADAPDTAIRQAIAAARAAVDPHAGIMVSAAGFRGRQGEGAVLLTAHHLVTDTWSWSSIGDRLRLGLVGRDVPPDRGFALYTAAVARQVSAGAYDLEAELWRGVLTAGRTAPLDGRPAALHHAEITIPETEVLAARWAASAPHVLLAALGDALHATGGTGATVIDLERNGRASVTGLDLSSAAGWIALHHPLPVSHRPLSHESIADLRQSTDAVPDFGLGYSALRWLRGTDLGGRAGRLAVNITAEPAAPRPRNNQAAQRVRSLLSAPATGRDLAYHGTLTFSRGDGETVAALDFDPGQIPAEQASSILTAIQDAAAARRPARSKPTAGRLPGPAALTVPTTAMQQMMLHHAGSMPGAYLPRQVLQISGVSSPRKFLDAASTFLGGIEPFNRRFRTRGGRIVQEWLKDGQPLRASIRPGGRQAALAWISSQSTLANGDVLSGRAPAELTAFHEGDTLYLGMEVHHALIDGVSNAQVVTLVEELAGRFPSPGRQLPDQSARHQSAVRKHAACELAAGPAAPAPLRESPQPRSPVATQETVLDAGQVLRISEWAAAHGTDLRAALAAAAARAGREAYGARALYAVVNGRDPDIPGSADALGMFWYFYETPIGDRGLSALARSAFGGAASPLNPVRAAALRWAAWDSSGTSFNFTKQAAKPRPRPRVAVIASRDTFHFEAQVNAVLRSDGSVKLMCTVAGDLPQLAAFPVTVAGLAARMAGSGQAALG